MAIPPPLVPYVASCTAYAVDMGAPGVHRGLPGTTLTLVLPVGEPLDVSWAGAPGSRQVGWSSLSGLHPRPAAIRHSGYQEGVQVALTPAGARALLGVPAAALQGELLEVGDVAPARRHLPEELAGTPHRDRAPLVLRRLAAAVSSRAPAARAEVGRALARLTAGAEVQRVAEDVGYSRRHLGDLIRAEYGLSPRQLRRIGRFERSRAGVASPASLASVAAANGYADQAHLTREWVALAGCPPSTWRREELPFVQDLPAVDEGGWTHE